MFFWGGKCSYDLGGSTLPETNSSPQKLDELEDFLLSFWDSAYFQVLLLLVSGSVLEKNAFFCIAKRHCFRRFVCQPIAFAKAPPWPWFIGARQVPAMVEQGPVFRSCFVGVLLPSSTNIYQLKHQTAYSKTPFCIVSDLSR